MVARKAGLTRNDVVETAVALADSEGLPSLTLASVATRLGVRSPSLYAHVDGLPGLHRLLTLGAASRMAGALRGAAEDAAGLEALRRVAFAYREFAQRHPGQYAAVQTAVGPGEDDTLYMALAEVAGPAIKALAEAGVATDDRVHLTRAFRSALHGFVTLEEAGGFGMPESVEISFARLVELILAGVGASAGVGR